MQLSNEGSWLFLNLQSSFFKEIIWSTTVVKSPKDKGQDI